ncbi:MAG: glycosyltransferase family 9 protein [Methylotetracoccus sp.]
MTRSDIRSPQNILVVRLTAIGDIVMASGVIPCLHTAFPDARLCWLVEEGNEELLSSNPRLDRVFVWPRRRWKSLLQQRRYLTWWREFRALRSALRQVEFDWVIDLQGLLKSGVWAWLAGGRRRIGLGSREGSALLMTEVVERENKSPLIAKEYRKLMDVLGTAPERFAMDIVVPPKARMSAEALLANAGGDTAYAVLCPFTTRPQKHWFDERWIELAGTLHETLGLRPVIVGGPGERQRGAEMAAAAGHGTVSLAGLTHLDECAAVLQGASLVIGVDTGWTHAGIALRRPTLSLLGSTDPYFDTGSPSARALYHVLPCFPCYRHPTCNGDYTCMRLHTVADVLSAAAALLGEHLPTQGAAMTEE